MIHKVSISIKQFLSIILLSCNSVALTHIYNITTTQRTSKNLHLFIQRLCLLPNLLKSYQVFNCNYSKIIKFPISVPSQKPVLLYLNASVLKSVNHFSDIITSSKIDHALLMLCFLFSVPLSYLSYDVTTAVTIQWWKNVFINNIVIIKLFYISFYLNFFLLLKLYHIH